MEAITTNNLTKYYGKSRGIVDINLSVQEGDFFGFIGPNGAGKSTTIRTLLGLITATKGSARIFGQDIQKQKRAVLEDVGYLPSEAMFYNRMRVGEILRLSADLRQRIAQTRPSGSAVGCSWIPPEESKSCLWETGRRSASSAPCSISPDSIFSMNPPAGWTP